MLNQYSTHVRHKDTLAEVDMEVQADTVVVLVAHNAFTKIPRDEVLRRVVIDASGLFQRSGSRN
jgi:UDP-N-acetyl-D-mannosaminuronate dehydrogenase